MRVPVSWLREYVDLPAEVTARQIADRPLASGAVPGQDAIELLQLRDDVLDIAITPDRGYTASIRGIAREAATAFGVAFRDPAGDEPEAQTAGSYPGSVADPRICTRYVLREA